MAHLTKPPKYEIEGSNIELFGSDIEKKVHEHAGDTESAWANAGQASGTQIWRIEDFRVVAWPKERAGTFYDGDSYIVMHTFKKDPNAEVMTYDLHFWLGHETSQDEAGTAAYKTVELDDHLHGAPSQYREVQGSESNLFLSYFPRFTVLHGGHTTGFHHIASPPPLTARRLYRISGDTARLVIREVPADDPSSLVGGDAYVLDKGTVVWQMNTKGSTGKERFKAAEVAHEIVEARKGACEVEVFDEGGRGAGRFLAEFGLEELSTHVESSTTAHFKPTLFRISDQNQESTSPAFTPVNIEHGSPTLASLGANDAYILDASLHPTAPAIYVWIGSGASLTEGKYALRYAERYAKQLRGQSGNGEGHRPVGLVRLRQGGESEVFLKLLRPQN